MTNVTGLMAEIQHILHFQMGKWELWRRNMLKMCFKTKPLKVGQQFFTSVPFAFVFEVLFNCLSKMPGD